MIYDTIKRSVYLETEEKRSKKYGQDLLYYGKERHGKGYGL